MTASNPSIEETLRQALDAHRAGNLQLAERTYRAILEVAPAHAEANRNLAVLALGVSRPDAAVAHSRIALESAPADERCWATHAESLFFAGQRQRALEVLAEAKRRGVGGAGLAELERRLTEPGEESPSASASQASAPDAREMQALVDLFNQKRLGEAATLANLLTDRFPRHPFAWTALGATLRELGRVSEAIRPLRTAAQLSGDADSYNSLGLALQEAGSGDEAEASFRRAIQIRGDQVEAHYNLGRLLKFRGRPDEAEASLRRAIQLRPDLAETHNMLGILMQDRRRWSESVACSRRAVELNPDFVEAHTCLGAALCAIGELKEAEASFRKALQLRPADTAALSNLLFIRNYSAVATPARCLEEARGYGQIVTRKATKPFSGWPATSESGRLRLGFVSGDLCSHPVGYFLENLVANIDTLRFDLFAYPTDRGSDDLTTRIRSRFAAWNPIAGLNDQAASRLIHDDGIQVLIDLSGHTSRNRLGVFAWKPAPVQVSWLGYFATTGVPQIDYLLADACSVPPAHRDHFSEEVWYLPDTRLCFTPPDADLPVVPAPAQSKGHITLGSFQNLAKLGDEVLALWAQVLAALPDARLRIQNKQLSDAAVRERLAERLRHAGVALERIALHGLMPRGDYLVAHGEVDFILDSFPFPGGTTTCEALWMGVPTLTLAGDRLVARQGASLLQAAGLADWIAKSKREYLAMAVAFGRDIPRLAALRETLRSRVLASPLFDAQRFARNFECAVAEMWKRRGKS